MKRFLLEYLPAWLLLAVMGFIVIHAPITVYIGSHFPQATLIIKAWKELFIGLALILLLVQLIQSGKLRAFVRWPLIIVLLIYCALHIFMIGIYPQGVQATLAGLLIDLRYCLYFIAMAALLFLYPQYKTPFVRVGVVGACIVVSFAAIELALPRDTLTYLGYSDATIQPYMTVDKNPDYIRYNSTLRGPNPLGAYALIVLTAVATFFTVNRNRLGRYKRRYVIGAGVLGVLSIVALWVSYSRSAVIGAVAAILVLVAAISHKVSPRNRRIVIACVLVLMAGGLFAVKDTTAFKNIVLHDNPSTGASVDSHTAHAESLKNGLSRMATEPLGAGIGSTGSASLFTGNGLIIENQYLMIAHETGWMGILLFLFIIGMLLGGLWRRRSEWLSLAVFASGIGLCIVGLMLPVWADDTVSIVWWGLAAVALTGGMYGQNTANKKAKRTA